MRVPLLPIVLPGLVLAALALPTPAAAKNNDDVVRAAGACSKAAHWKLKTKYDSRGLEVEFEIDSNKPGQSWSWKLTDNGVKVAAGKARTSGRSGSFSVERRVPDRGGIDTIRLVASRGGQTCAGTLLF